MIPSGYAIRTGVPHPDRSKRTGDSSGPRLKGAGQRRLGGHLVVLGMIVGLSMTDGSSVSAAAPVRPQEGRTPQINAESARLMIEIERVDRAYWAMRRGSAIKAWELDRFRAAYEGLWQSSRAEPERRLLRRSLGQVASDDRLRATYLAFQEALARSRQRDVEIAEATRAVQSRLALNLPFSTAARGIYQRSDRLHQGRAVDVLVGSDGRPSAYLLVPIGMETQRFVSRRVLIDGEGGFDAELRARLIRVVEIRLAEG